MTPTFNGALRTALASTTALTFATAAGAQQVIELDAITVTANRADTETARSGSSVDIVTREDLESAGDTTVAGYLESLPGINVTANGGLGTSTTLRLRGLPGRYIGVYIDGIDVNDPSATQISFDFGTLTTAGIGRVEVLKGAQSALYGSEAIAGVIDISTNRATEPGYTHSYGAEYGSYDTTKLGYNLSWLGDRGSYALTFSRIETDGFSAADENAGNDEPDGHEGTRLSFSGDYALTDTVTIGGAAFWQDTYSEYDDRGPADGDTPDEHWDETSWGLRAFVQLQSGIFDHEVSAQYYQNDRVSEGTNRFGAFRFPYLGERVAVAYAGQAQLSPALTLAFGADATRERAEDRGEHDLIGTYAEAAWAPSAAFDIVTSVRRDEHSDFGGKTTGRVAAAWRPAPDVTLRLAAGTGFRTPSPYELYDPQYGNAALDPETSTSFEIGAERTFGEAGFIRATLFRTEVTDLIQWQVTDLVTFDGQYQQVPGTSRIRGAELSGGWALSDDLHFEASYTWLDGEEANGSRLNRVPRGDLALRLKADVTERLAADLSVNRITDVLDNGTPLPDYTVAGLNLRYAVTDDAETYLRIENLFNEEYQTLRGYGTSDRAVYVGLRGRF